MVVRAADVPRSWGVTFAPTGFQIGTNPVEADAELAVIGNVADIYVMLWNRRDTSGLELDGRTDLLDLWRETVRIIWS